MELKKLLVLAGVGLLALGLSAGAAWFVRSRWVGPREAEYPALTEEKHAQLVTRGRLAFQVYCAACHGPEGRGDGPSAPEMKPPPRDFAVAPWKFGTTPSAIRQVIVQGIPGTAMPASAQTLSTGDVDALVAYVLTLVPSSQPSATHSLMSRIGLNAVTNVREAPAIQLRDTSDKASALAQWRGKLVVLVFWETTCVPCLNKLPQLERLADEFRDKGVVIVPVCINEGDIAPVRGVAEKHLKSLPLYIDVDGLARFRFDVAAVPKVCLIDQHGRLVASGPGPSDWAGPEVKELLRACLAGH